MSTEEPASKKAKTDEVDADEPTGWEDHTMNISEAVMKADEGKHINDLKDAEVSTLQGIGKFSSEVLKSLGVQTVADLAKYKFFLMARSLKTLAETEVKGDRPEGSVMNVDKAVDKSWEAKSLTEIVEAPTEALEGIGDDACELLESLGVKSIGDLADFKYCRWAEAIVNISAYEELKTAKQRKIEAALRKLK
mmetsp:Transcript_119659/g.178766  ORF Transcript_119659/g.178766 Transcript_119659/m.178766 type:complete len:193 (-) Transcript_119659:223-801(-)|eukprot:CAMPEP_0117027204 /NCGR_PEP_ID=MMETSP0472-20121206/19908_1 /TAXON_ID=693140 ORGANISM="Tiarina fusus, Strain LIS" /NCGR_SAMPLE_ID=MMETSP0472 /ASSEMBLY_ACC=CAM_ASM_000603 /LENGTH=192 /DNA_ID=CAMNT_0004734387 /DNA_START=144 /DNA_END=722 /DNA_ORIENTATION=+